MAKITPTTSLVVEVLGVLKRNNPFLLHVTVQSVLQIDVEVEEPETSENLTQSFEIHNIIQRRTQLLGMIIYIIAAQGHTTTLRLDPPLKNEHLWKACPASTANTRQWDWLVLAVILNQG